MHGYDGSVHFCSMYGTTKQVGVILKFVIFVLISGLCKLFVVILSHFLQWKPT